jgi:lipopolysaccharide export system protein LptA
MVSRKRILTFSLLTRIIFSLLGLPTAFIVHAQPSLNLPEQLTANLVETKGLTQILTGNVKLRHKGVVLFCNQAVHDIAMHSVRVNGHVLVVQGDSITARGDSANFAYSNRRLQVYGRVMFQDHRTILTTTQFDYDLAAGVVTYSQKGRIVDDKNVLTSLRGIYNVQLKQFTCQQSVQLATRKSTVRAESMVYNTVTQRSAILPKVVNPTEIEQPTAANQLVHQDDKRVTATLATHQPVAEQVLLVITPAPVAKQAILPKTASSLPASVLDANTKLATAATNDAPKTNLTAIVPPKPQPTAAFSSAVNKPHSPTFQQAIPATSSKSAVVSTFSDISDLEVELNKKKRFH